MRQNFDGFVTGPPEAILYFTLLEKEGACREREREYFIYLLCVCPICVVSTSQINTTDDGLFDLIFMSE